MAEAVTSDDSAEGSMHFTSPWNSSFSFSGIRSCPIACKKSKKEKNQENSLQKKTPSNMAFITDLYRQSPWHMNHTACWRNFQALMKLPALAFCIQGELRPKLSTAQPLQLLAALAQGSFTVNSSRHLNASSAFSDHLASASTLNSSWACPSKESKERSFFSHLSQPWGILCATACSWMPSLLSAPQQWLGCH